MIAFTSYSTQIQDSIRNCDSVITTVCHLEKALIIADSLDTYINIVSKKDSVIKNLNNQHLIDESRIRKLQKDMETCFNDNIKSTNELIDCKQLNIDLVLEIDGLNKKNKNIGNIAKSTTILSLALLILFGIK